MSKKILLFGAGFHDNLGDDLILNCVNEELKANGQDVTYIVPLTKKLYFDMGGYKELRVPMFKKYKNKIRKLLALSKFLLDKNALREYDSVVFYGGGYTNEAFGMKNLLDIYLIAHKAHSVGAKVFFTGQTVGPCDRFSYNKILRLIYKTADKVFVREEFSLEKLKNSKIDATLVADDAFLAYPCVTSDVPKRRIILNYKVFGNLEAEKDRIFELYKRVAAFYKDKLIITVIPFRSDVNTKEFQVNKELFDVLQKAGYKPEFKVESDFRKFIRIFNEAQVVFGSAYHSIVLGKMCGATVCSTYCDEYYRMKIGGFLNLYNEKDIFVPFEEFVSLSSDDFKAMTFKSENYKSEELYQKVKKEWREIID